MSKEESNAANAENPETFTGLKLGLPKKHAAGIPAVVKAMQHIFSEAGIVRGLKALHKLNPDYLLGFLFLIVSGVTLHLVAQNGQKTMHRFRTIIMVLYGIAGILVLFQFVQK